MKWKQIIFDRTTTITPFLARTNQTHFQTFFSVFENSDTWQIVGLRWVLPSFKRYGTFKFMLNQMFVTHKYYWYVIFLSAKCKQSFMIMSNWRTRVDYCGIVCIGRRSTTTTNPSTLQNVCMCYKTQHSDVFAVGLGCPSTFWCIKNDFVLWHNRFSILCVKFQEEKISCIS